MSGDSLFPITLSTVRLLEEATAAHIAQQIQIARSLYPKDGFFTANLDSGLVAITTTRFGHKLNLVAGFAMNGPVTEETLEKLEGAFSGVGLPPYIDVTPFADPSARQLLGQKGYTVSGHINSYIMGLKDYTEPETTPNSDIKIVRVPPGDNALEEIFVRLSVEAFKPGGRSIELLTLLAETAVRREDTELYLAYIDGQVAGGAGTAIIDTNQGQVPILYIMSTLPELRGRGVQTALLRAQLADVKERGFDIAAVHTRPGTGSARNVERAGFKLAYVKEIFTKTA